MKKNYSCNSRWGLKALSAAALALAFTVSASAQDYRKSWNFTKWSSETVANLKAANSVGGNTETREWSDVEKSGNSTPTDMSKDNCFWNWKSQGSTTEDRFLTANGTVIAETEGLYVTNTNNGGLAIAVDYINNPDGFGPYEGAAYLWLGGSKNNYFVIPHVAPGTEIKMGVESHKLSDARGVELYVGRGTSGTKLLDPDGNAVALPTTFQDLVWLVPEGLADTPNEDGTYDIQIYNTNGCHIYYITVGDGDEGGAEEDKKIAVVSPEGEDDPLYFAVQEGFETTFISDAADATLEKLQEYEAILVSNKVAAGTALADALKSAVAYQPMVNLNTALIEAWGMGKVAATESNTITIADANLDNALFADLSYDEGLELVAEGTLPVITPAEYLANDDVLATVGNAAYILVHNANRNAHILIPFAAEAATDGENMIGLVANALKVAAKSKKAVTNASAPTFSAVQGNLETTVTISGAGVIRYALGADAEVNESSAIYTDPIRFTEATMIKAYAVQDGYLPSAVATYEVAIAAKAEKPVITVTPGDKAATITFEAQEGAEIHFSFKGQAESSRTNSVQTAVYTEPVVVTEPTTVYAFAIGDGLLASDLEEMVVDIPGVNASNIRLDVVSRFTGGSAWKSAKLDGVAVEGLSNANVFMGNHKSDGTFGVSNNHSKPWKHYSEEIDHTEEVQEQAKDEDGNLKFEADGVTPVMETVTKTYYKVDPASYHELTCDGEPDWKLVSEGQCIGFETSLGANSYMFDFTKSISTDKPVGVISATDLISESPSTGVISWKGKNSGEPYNGRLESTVAFDAPFDIVVFLRNAQATTEVKQIAKVLTSTDGKEWTNLAELETGTHQRSINRHRLSVEGEGKYYVRVEHNGQNLQLHDVIIYNNGELSKEYTGVAEVIADEAAEVISVEYYNINGMRIAEPENGFCIMRATLSNGNVVVKKIVK